MKRIVLLVVSFACAQLHAQNQNIFSGKFTAEKLQSILIPQSQWTPFPKITDRTAWSKADQNMMKSFFDKGMTYVNYEWPSIPATTSLLIERTGDRASFDAMNGKRREVLGTLLLAEIYENKGRFM